LPNLHIEVAVARVDRGAGGADRRSQGVGELLDELELLFRPECATPEDHDVGGLQRGAL